MRGKETYPSHLWRWIVENPVISAQDSNENLDDGTHVLLAVCAAVLLYMVDAWVGQWLSLIHI